MKLQQKLLHSLGFIFLTFTIIGCGGGSDGSSPSLPNPNKYISGVAVDGYLNGATVFLDLNANNTLDSDEPNTKTKFDGSYSLKIPKDTNSSVQIVVFGGIDIDTDKEFSGILKNRLDNKDKDNKLNLTPITTLTIQLLQEDFSLSLTQAKDLLYKFVDINASDSVKDPIASYSTNPNLYHINRQLVELVKLMRTDSSTTTDSKEFMINVMQKLSLKAQQGEKLNTLTDITIEGNVLNMSSLSTKAKQQGQSTVPTLPENKYKSIKIDNQIFSIGSDEYKEKGFDTSLQGLEHDFSTLSYVGNGYTNTNPGSRVIYQETNSSYNLENDHILIVNRDSNISVNIPEEIYGLSYVEENRLNENLTRSQYIAKHTQRYVSVLANPSLKQDNYILFTLRTNDIQNSDYFYFYNLILDVQNKKIQVLNQARYISRTDQRAYSFSFLFATYNDKIILKNFSQANDQYSRTFSYQLAKIIKTTDTYSFKLLGETSKTAPSQKSSNGRTYGAGDIGILLKDFNDDGKMDLFMFVQSSYYQTGTTPLGTPQGHFGIEYYVSSEQDICSSSSTLHDEQCTLHFKDAFNRVYATTASESNKLIFSYKLDFDTNTFQFFGINNLDRTVLKGNPYFVKNDTYSENSTNREKRKSWEDKTLSDYTSSFTSLRANTAKTIFLLEKEVSTSQNSPSRVAAQNYTHTILYNFNFDTLEVNDHLYYPDGQALGTCAENYPGWLRSEPQLVGQCQSAYFYACNKDLYKDSYPAKVPEFNRRLDAYCGILDGYKKTTNGERPIDTCQSCKGYPFSK